MGQNLARMVTEYVMSKRASARIMFLTRMCPVNCVSIVMCGQIVVDWKLIAHGDERAKRDSVCRRKGDGKLDTVCRCKMVVSGVAICFMYDDA